MKLLLSLIVGVALMSALRVAAAVKIEEQVVGPASEPGTIYWLSPKGLRLATAHPKGSRFVVTVDGVEGEKYDEILKAAAKVETRYDNRGNPIIENVMWKVPVAFSPDGSHHAYAARLGKEVVVILDGKEIYRTPHSLAVEVVARLSFTPDSKHLCFYAHTGETMGSYRLMMDGKPVTPTFVGTPPLIYSADGTHWALQGNKPMKDNEIFLVVDGKVQNYTGQRYQFMPDGKLVCTKSGDGKEAVLVDGKPLMAAAQIDKTVISPNGDIGVIAYASGGKRGLYINGKPAGGENVMSVIFSPDGKHWAASCVSSPSFYVIVDGKKHQEYSMVRSIAFTPDSSKCVYIAESGQKKFVVINGEEDEGGTHISIEPMFGKSGGQVAYCNVQAWQVMNVHHGDKIVPKMRQVSELTLSPNGARHAYYNALDAMSGQLIVDGEVKGGGTAYKDSILFSPDSQHFVAMSSAPSNGRRAICLDGKFVPIPKGLDQYTKPLGFTPDSQHLLMRGQEIAKEGGYYMDKYFLDGQYVAQFFAGGIFSGILQGNRQLTMQSEFWEMQPDGSLLIIGHENFQENKRGGVVKRVKITPDASTSLATWIAGANESKPAASNQNARQNPVATTQSRNPQTSNINSIPPLGQQPAPSVIQTNADAVTATNVLDKVNKAANATKAAADSLKRLFGK
jgi:WD40 repeat protein